MQSLHAWPIAVAGIAAGWYHGLAIAADGSVWAWGRGTEGELGNGGTVSSSTPVQVSGLADVVQVSGGYNFSAAVKSDGTVWAWGRNNYGQLGDGTTTDHHTLIQVPSLSNVVAVSGAGYTSAALTADGSVWVWGLNNYGQLGDGTTTTAHSPQKVPGLSGVVALSMGYNHVAAVTASGQVWAWGFNGDGEVGDGTTTNRLSPVLLANLSGVTQVSAGIGHTVALTGGGAVFAWGYGGYGEIGDGATANSLVPVRVPGLSGVSVVAGGDLHSLAMTPAGALWAWGGNDYGRLGDGTTTNALSVEQISRAGASTVLTDHYDMNGDSPAWTSSSDGGWTRHVIGLDGNLDATVTYTPSTGATATVLQLSDLHGDVVATADPGGTGVSATYTYDAFGNPTDANTARYGWLGGKTRATTGIGALTLMGVRLYNPATGRFLQTDPIPGGSCNPYDYACQDPVNGLDLDGTCSWWDVICIAKKAADAIWATNRAADNLANGSTQAGLIWAHMHGAHCKVTKGLMILCTGMQGGVAQGAHAFTVGNVIMTSDDKLLKGELAHETKHADQWALLGWRIVPLYIMNFEYSDYRLNNQCDNFFEWWAGFKGGRYSC